MRGAEDDLVAIDRSSRCVPVVYSVVKPSLPMSLLFRSPLLQDHQDQPSISRIPEAAKKASKDAAYLTCAPAETEHQDDKSRISHKR